MSKAWHCMERGLNHWLQGSWDLESCGTKGELRADIRGADEERNKYFVKGRVKGEKFV